MPTQTNLPRVERSIYTVGDRSILESAGITVRLYEWNVDYHTTVAGPSWMKVVVTGGLGFVGSHVAEHFAKKCEAVLVCARSNPHLNTDTRLILKSGDQVNRRDYWLHVRTLEILTGQHALFHDRPTSNIVVNDQSNVRGWA